MPTYRYQAANQQGRLVRGSLLAATREGALARLREMGYLPVNMREATVGGVSAGGSGAWHSRSGGRGLSARDVAGFTSELADLLGAGLELDRALSVLSETGGAGSRWGGRSRRGGDRRAPQDLVVEIRAEVQSGKPLAEVLALYPKAFSPAYVGLVRSGETAGNLDVILARLAGLLQAEANIKGFVRRSLVYPAIVAMTCLLAIAVMMTFVIPRFSRIFAYLGQQLPWPTRLLVALSRFLVTNGLLLAGLLVAVVVLAGGLLATDRGRLVVDRWLLHGPPVSGLYRDLTVARLARTLGALLGNGVTLSNALAVVTGAEPNRVVRDLLATVGRDVAGGAPVSRSLAEVGLFPGRAAQVLRVGEETGGLDTMFGRVAETFEAETKSRIESLLALLEPALILAMALVVAFVILAMLLPVLSLNNLAL